MSVCIGFNEALYLVLACAFTLGWIGRSTLSSIKKWWRGLDEARRDDYTDYAVLLGTGMAIYGTGMAVMWLVVV